MLTISNSLLTMTALFNAGLMVFILRGNWKKPTNLFFGVFLFALSAWALVLIGYQTAVSSTAAIYFGKAAYAAALVIGMSLYLFSIAFPDEIRPRKKTILIACCVSALYIIALLEPSFLIQKITIYEWGKEVVEDPLEYLIFFCIFCFFYIGGVVRMWLKYFRSQGISRTQLLVLALSTSITGAGGMYYNLVLASPFVGDFQYLWTGPLFGTSVSIIIMYSIFRFHLFNAKVIATELTISLLWIFTFLRTLLASDIREQIFNGGLFLLSLVIGSLLIRSVYKEVQARELIEKQEKELEMANQRQENLIHFISHEVKGYFTKSEGAFAAIAEGDFGEAPPDIKNLSERALADVRKGVETIMNILSAGDLKKGTIPFAMQMFDMRTEVARVVEELRSAALERHLALDFVADGSANYAIVGDAPQLSKHVFSNIIGNAIQYTKQGSVRISLSRERNAILLTVKDTGVGITETDKDRLFTEGGRGSESIKMNAHSTGYGLFIAKSIVDAHRGRIWAESEGTGKGSTFYVELPAKT